MTDVAVGFVDVGQGDCTLAVDRETGDAIMIDCPAEQGSTAIKTLDTLGAKRLKVVVVTHNDLDHFGGVFHVVTSLPTTTIRMNEATVVPADPDERKRLKAALRSISGLRYRNIEFEDARRGDADQTGDISWEILTPTKPQLLHAQGIGNANHASVVIRLDVLGHRFLIAGDADGASWRSVLDAGMDVRATVFLFPHHGAELSDSNDAAGAAEILDAIAPEFVILSFGATNCYGHPHPDTLRLLARRNQTLLAMQDQTKVGPLAVTPARVGTAIFQIDGSGLSLAA